MAFVSVPIISKALGPEQYGVYNYVIAIAGYAFLPANWGFMAKGIRDVAKTSKNKWQIVEQIISARLTLWWIGGIFTILLCYLLFKSENLSLYIFLAILTNIGLASSIDFYFYGKKDTFTPSLSNLIGQIIFLLLVWLFIKTEKDLFILLIINIFYRLVESMIMLIIYRKKNKLNITLFSKKAIPLLKENFLLGMGAKASFFQTSFPLILIPVFLNTYDLGVYSATFKLFLVISLLIQSINLVFSPWIVESKKELSSKRNKLFGHLLFGYALIGIFSALFLYLLGPHLMNMLFGEKYIDSQNLIVVFAMVLAPILPIHLLLTNYMNNYEKDKQFFKGSIVQGIITVISLPLFLYFLGLNGAIYSLGLSLFVVVIYYFKCLWPNVKI